MSIKKHCKELIEIKSKKKNIINKRKNKKRNRSKIKKDSSIKRLSRKLKQKIRLSNRSKISKEWVTKVTNQSKILILSKMNKVLKKKIY